MRNKHILSYRSLNMFTKTMLAVVKDVIDEDHSTVLNQTMMHLSF